MFTPPADDGGAPGRVDARHVRTDDGIVKAVSGVSFSLEQGATLGVVGESGSGKSVTFLTVMGLVDPRQSTVTGSVKLDGEEMLGMGQSRLRQIRGKRMSGGSAARTHASWWLLADDAVRGDWDAVVARAPRDRRDDSALECFPEAVARVLGRQSPLGGGLLGVWLGEGAVAGALRWMIRAERADLRPAPEPPARTGDPLADAVRTHAYVLSLPRTEVRAADLVRVGEAWARVEEAASSMGTRIT